MKRLMNLLRGMVSVRIVGVFPERLINLCAQEGVEFWALDWIDAHTLTLTTRRSQRKLLEQLAARIGCEVTTTRSRGLPDFALRFRSRYAFLAGLCLCLVAVSFLSQFILRIEVTGNERVPTAVILNELNQLGIRVGVYGPKIERQQAAQEAVLRLEDLSWMGINLHGTCLEVIVRERVLPPKRVDETGLFDIVSNADGIILKVDAELGDAAVKAGDTVLAGETLISGTMTIKPPLFSEVPERYYYTHARGNVLARTWRTITAQIPATAQVKEYDGKGKTSYSIQLAGKQIGLFAPKKVGRECELLKVTKQLVLPTGIALPIALVKQTSQPYTISEVALESKAAEQLLESQLAQYLNTLIGDSGKVLTSEYTTQITGDMIQVTLVAQCQEEIGVEVEKQMP